MAIKFLSDYRTRSIPPEVFTKGQIITGRAPESELHFVTRGVAAFRADDGALTDHEGRPVAEGDETAIETITVSNNRDGEVGRAGEVALDDGTPQRASSGPGVVVTTSVLTGESKPARAKK